MLSNYQKEKKNEAGQGGFSLIELIIVVLVISILSILSVLSFKAEKKYLADQQAYEIIDLLSEARQRSLTQQQTIRVEINQTRNSIRLIAENEPGDAADDKELKSVKLQERSRVVVGVTPKNVYKSPAEMSPTPVLSFKKSVHPLSAEDTVATLRFVRTGKVVDAGSNAVGDNSVMNGATIYVWSPHYSPANEPLETGSLIRAVTVQGTSGISGFWKCSATGARCETWVR